ncbi:MAG: NAD-dependent epimerase/dehydratase family protein [Solirubrobacterales bacterium]
MKVFVAGATGAIGRPLIRQLVAAGHEVTGMTRRSERAAELREAGAEAVVCDVFDADGLREAVVAARPEAVVHALTALPERFGPRTDLRPTNRLRTEGTRNLIAAAQAAGARRVIAESVAFFYAPEGGWVKDEEAPLDLDAPGKFGPAVDAVADLERQVLEAEGIEGLVLRFGWFYGSGTYISPGGSQVEEVRKRRYPVVGEGDATFSFIHIEDAASAVVAALDHGASGIYNVVDDEPSPMREWLPLLAETLGAKPPHRLPAWLVRLAVGKAMARSAVGTRGASNAKAKRELGWQPAHRSWRQGFPELFAS